MQAWFQHAAARRRLKGSLKIRQYVGIVSTRSRPKAADAGATMITASCTGVSTRSRPKAADYHIFIRLRKCVRFQHAAARRRLIWENYMGIGKQIVSTRSRPKAAERQKQAVVAMRNVSTRSRPKAAEAHKWIS